MRRSAAPQAVHCFAQPLPRGAVPPCHGHPGARLEVLSPWMVGCRRRRLRLRLPGLRGLRLRRCRRGTGPAQELDGEVALADPEVDVPAKPAFNDDLGTRPDPSGLPLRDLPVPVLEADAEVTGHLPGLRLGKQGLEVDAGRQGPVRVEGVTGLDREALVPERNPVVGQEPVRRFESGDVRHPHLLDQAVLRRTEGPLDTSLRLGRACQDHLDPQLAQRPGDDRVGPLLLLRQPLPEVSGVVRVDSQGAAVALQVSDDRPAVLRTVVALDEAGRHQPARRIVVDRDQHELPRPVLQPHMHRAVPLFQLAQRRPPRTPATMPGPPALPLPQPGLHHPVPQRVRTHPHGEASLQVFGEQRRPEVPVQPLSRDLQRPLAKRLRQRPVRTPPAQSVHHGRIPLILEPPAQPAKMPWRDSDPRRSRTHAQHSLPHLPQHRDAIPLLQTQVHPLLSRIPFRR